MEDDRYGEQGRCYYLYYGSKWQDHQEKRQKSRVKVTTRVWRRREREEVMRGVNDPKLSRRITASSWR